MAKNFRTGGTLLLALLAVGAAFSSAASATDFTAAKYPVSLHGESPASAAHKFEVGGGVIECSATFAGTGTAASTSQTVAPSYVCHCYGLNCTVTMNGCDYVLRTEAGLGQNGTLDIVCPAGKQITIDTAGNLCNTHIGPQTGLAGVSYANNGNHIDLTMNVKTMHMVVTGTILCPITTSTTTYTNGAYTGTATLKGDGGATKIDIG